jgi:molybdate transport system ATP-binding protein
MADALTLEICKRFPNGSVIEADLRLSQATLVTVLFGPSGSGKTTILRCLAGLETPERGSIRCGQEIWYDAARGFSLAPQKRRVGYLFQEYALFPHLTVKGNVEYGLSHDEKRKREQRVGCLLDLFQLSDLENRYPHQLSGGQLQRVALARALAPEPKLLLLDEPLSALDDPTRSRLRGELRRLLTQVGVPTLLVTHERMEAIALGDQLAVMVGGRIQQTGAVQEVFNYPANHAVAQSVGVESVVPGEVIGASNGLLTVRAGQARLTAVDPGEMSKREVYLCIRGEEVIVEKGASSQDSARNHLAGRVTSIIPEGALVRVMLDCGVPIVALVTRQSCEELKLAEGDGVTAVIKATAVHLVPRTPAPN